MVNMIPRLGSPFTRSVPLVESRCPFGEHQPVRVESYTDEGDFVVGCELPGLDPERDIHLTVEGDQLKINAERTAEERTDQRSQFRYGSFSRTMTLPTDGDTAGIGGSLRGRDPDRTEHAREQGDARGTR